MRGVFQNLIGTKSGRLTVVDGPFKREKKKGFFWLCQCDCGKMLPNYIGSNSLIKQKSQSCGCLMIDRVKQSNTTHGLTKTRTYVSWRSMWQRCTDSSHKSYEYYKKFVPVDRWKSFETFLLDMGNRPKNMSIDRIDGEKPYSPENCRWATIIEQGFNKKTTIVVEIDNQKMSMRQACKLIGSDYARAKSRVRNGWSPYDAVTTPKTNRYKRMV
jgi:hypothetical protein